MRAWPDAAAVEARLQKVWRRSALQSVLRGVAAGLIAGAVLIAIGVRSPVIASPASAVAVPAIIGAVLAFARARRHRHRVALTVEARVPACQNVVITSTEIARGDRELRDDVSARVHADALRAMTALTPATLVPIGRDVAAVAVALMLVAGATLLKARAEAPGLRVVDPASAEVRRLTVTVTPPAYAGLPAEVLADPERLTALEGSRIALRITANATTLVVTTLAGATTVQPQASGDFAVEIDATAPGFIAVEPRAADGHAGDRRLIPLTVTPDRVPVVRIVTPGKDLFVNEPRRSLEIGVTADDDLGLASLTLKYTKATGSGENFTFKAGDVPLTLTRTSSKSWTGRVLWQLDPLAMEPGDVIVYRAVATDHRPGRAPVESDAFLIELMSPTEVAAEGFAVDDQREKYALSQQMIILKTERLLAAKPKMTADAFTDGALTIAAEQRTVRAEFVFMMGGEIEDEEVEAENEHEIQEGRLGTGGRLDVVRAIRLMSQAAKALTGGAVDAALPIERNALTALQRAFSKNRLILRALTKREQLDMTRRLSGTLADVARGPRSAPTADADATRVAARQVLADTLEVARVTTFSRAHAAEMSNAAQELFRLAAVDVAFRPVATELSAAAALMTSGSRDDVRARLDRAATALAAVVRQRLPPAPMAGADLSGAALRGALDDALRKPGGVK